MTALQLRVDDLFGIRPLLSRHAIISSAETLLKSFAEHCREVLHVLLSHLENHLELANGTLIDLHRDDAPRGDFVSLQHRAAESHDASMVSKGEHTDFGSITMLFNWLGGLQIREQLPHNSEKAGDWVYIKPIPGCCVINLADSVVKLTAGLLKSNIHRVAPAPGLQGEGLPRYSLAYFAHPNDDVELLPVNGGLVDSAARAKADHDGEAVYTAAKWTSERSLGSLRGVWSWEKGIEWR